MKHFVIFVTFYMLLSTASAMAQMYEDSGGVYRNSSGGNIFGDSSINPMADPDINPMADPDIYPMGDAYMRNDGTMGLRSKDGW